MEKEYNDDIYSDFAYDDAFRTVESECDDLLIPFVNYFHNENYNHSAKIIRGRNEHFIEHANLSDQKRVTDSGFTIEFQGRKRKYHYECESSRYDDSLLVRMFEYDAQIALDTADVDKQCLRVEFPYSGILLLRGKGDFDKADIELVTPGGAVRYPVAVRRMSDLDLDVIFDKDLYFLLPFYIFNYESRLNAIDSNPEELEKFVEMYREMVEELYKKVENQCLSAFSYGVIIRLINKVVHKMTMNRKNVQGKVGDIMGGKVLELDIIKARHEGIAEGRAEGIEEGRAEGRADGMALGRDKEFIHSVERLMEYNDITAAKACEMLGRPFDEYEEAKKKMLVNV